MPGAAHEMAVLGDRAENLAAFVLSSFAFATGIPRQRDVGHDFYCVLQEPVGVDKLVRAGPAFTIQVKSNDDPMTFRQSHEVDWLTSQENPFFVCIVDREALTVRIYSTWNRLLALHMWGPTRTYSLHVGDPRGTYPEVHDDGSHVVIPIGDPVLSISAADAMSEGVGEAWAMVLRGWIELDRRNIVNSSAGMFWTIGPNRGSYTTNEVLAPNEIAVAHFWNARNLTLCIRNLVWSATSLQLTARATQDLEPSVWQPRFEALARVLEAFEEFLGEPAKASLARERPPSTS